MDSEPWFRKRAGIVEHWPSYVMLAIMCYIAFVVYQAHLAEVENNRELECLSGLKQISISMFMYCEDYDSHFPPGNKWNIVDPRMRKYPMACPDTNAKLPTDALNSSMHDLRHIADPGNTVCVFESKPGENLCGGPELLPSAPRHSGGDHIGFADGHVKWVMRSDIGKYKWNPGQAGKP